MVRGVTYYFFEILQEKKKNEKKKRVERVKETLRCSAVYVTPLVLYTPHLCLFCYLHLMRVQSLQYYRTMHVERLKYLVHNIIFLYFSLFSLIPTM